MFVCVSAPFSRLEKTHFGFADTRKQTVNHCERLKQRAIDTPCQLPPVGASSMFDEDITLAKPTDRRLTPEEKIDVSPVFCQFGLTSLLI